MNMSVPLPHSKEAPYKGNYWGIIEKDLNHLAKNPSLDSLVQVIMKYVNRSENMSNMKVKLQQLEAVFSEDSQFINLIPTICSCALKLPEIFPEKHLQLLRRGEEKRIELTREQVSCLLANMFFCTIQPCSHLVKQFRGHFVGNRAPTGPLTFIRWLSTQSGPTSTYLHSLLNYFNHIAKADLGTLKAEKIVYERLVETKGSWAPKGNQNVIVQVKPHLEGRIGDKEEIEMDFANENVGFGTTGTQEELLLGPSPETCPIVLFNETLNNNEAIVIVGARKFGDFTGYGSRVRYTGPFSQEWDWNRRKIIAIDAICNPGNKTKQLEDYVMERELRKAFTGFSAAKGEIVATGHWGCGAFGGDLEVKAVVQILAASVAGVKELQFFCFGEQGFYGKLVQLCKVMEGKTVGWMWARVNEFRKNKDGTLLEFLGK